MKKLVLTLLSIALFLLAGCGAAPEPSPTPSPTPEPKTLRSELKSKSIWQSGFFGDRGGAVLFLNQMHGNTVKFELYYYEYLPLPDSEYTGIMAESIKGSAIYSENRLVYVCDYVPFRTDLTMEFELTGDVLSIDYTKAEFPDDFPGELTSGQAPKLSYDLLYCDIYLPVAFTCIPLEEAEEALEAFPANDLFDPISNLSAPYSKPAPVDEGKEVISLYGWQLKEYEIALPFAQPVTLDEIIQFMGEPVNIDIMLSAAYDLDFTNGEVVLMGPYGDKYHIFRLESGIPGCVPSVWGIDIGDDVESIVSSLLGPGAYEELMASVPETGVATMLLYKEQADSYPIASFKVVDGVPSDFCIGLGYRVNYHFDADGKVETIWYSELW